MASAPDLTPDSPSKTPLKPFRFKSKRPRSPIASDVARKRRLASPPTDREPSLSSQPRHQHHHHHSHRRRRASANPSLDTLFREDSVDPDTAFRESLFDALADDEGAAFWEGVYGQPINTYSPYYPTSTDPDTEDAQGSPRLERMTDEEYVSYVRAKMWEKSHGYIIEERRRRDEAARKKKLKEEERRKWQADLDDALERDAERGRRDKWMGVWAKYTKAWEGMDWNLSERERKHVLKDRICWPVRSGRWQNVTKEEIERFFAHAPDKCASYEQCDGKEANKQGLGDVLKKERVRWHPDKMQQRAGEEGLDATTMRLVTSVFQVLDHLWTDLNGRDK